MNFDNEVGTTLRLIVSQFTPHGGKPKINFEPKFEYADDLIVHALLDHMSQAEKDEVDRRYESEADYWMSHGSSRDYHMSRNRTCEHSTMRIYHLSGDQHPELVVGDEWECEVVKCYARTTSTPRDGEPDKIEWTEPKTKDGRTKIHFTVRPLQRIVTETQDVDWEKKGMVVTRVSGKNRSAEMVPFDKVVEGAFRHTDSLGGKWVVFGAVGYTKGEVAAVRIGPKEYVSPPDFVLPSKIQKTKTRNRFSKPWSTTC